MISLQRYKGTEVHKPIELTSLEKRILDAIQSGFPISDNPYGEIALAMGCAEEDAYVAVQRLRDDGVIRRIGGSFDARKMGYVSALVAARVATEHLDSVAAYINTFPEVTHNYERAHAYNLWFTIIAENRERLEALLVSVRGQEGVLAAYDLPAVRTFKLKVDFNFSDRAKKDDEESPAGTAAGKSASPPHPVAGELDRLDRQIITRLCGDLGGSRSPFREIAAEFNLPEEELLRRIRCYRAGTILRRLGAILFHQTAGFSANGMSVWNVPDADAEKTGEMMARAPEVSHCYVRPRLPDWPYNLFGMIHGHSEDECRAVAARISAETSIDEYDVLFSVRQFKKSSMVYT